MEQISGRPYWPVHADKDGVLDAVGSDLPAAVAAAGLSDLFVFSHGWCTSESDAESLYQQMFSLIADQVDSQAVTLPGIGFAGIFWPSLWFPDPKPSTAKPSTAGPSTAGPSTAGPSAEPSTAVPASVTGAQIAGALSPSYAGDPARLQAVNQLGALLDSGQQLVSSGAGKDEQQPVLDQFHALLGQILTTHPHAAEDAGEAAAVTAPDPAKAYTFLADTMGTGAAGGDAESLADPFSKIWSGAKDALRVASYYEMKCRAGDIGRAGLGPLLQRLRAAAPGVRVHLIGHSFGARLVSFALAGIDSPQASPVASLSLIQGAFSHWSFAGQQPFGAPGALQAFTDRVHGPLVSTFSSFDWAVSRWYPKASLLSNQDNQAAVSLTDRWGGMGGDGFRGVSPSTPATIAIPGGNYQLRAGGFHPIDSQAVVRDVSQSAFAGAHSDIQHPEIAWLIVAAASGSSSSSA